VIDCGHLSIELITREEFKERQRSSKDEKKKEKQSSVTVTPAAGSLIDFSMPATMDRVDVEGSFKVQAVIHQLSSSPTHQG
jgi:hypothetical protein